MTLKLMITIASKYPAPFKISGVYKNKQTTSELAIQRVSRDFFPHVENLEMFLYSLTRKVHCNGTLIYHDFFGIVEISGRMVLYSSFHKSNSNFRTPG